MGRQSPCGGHERVCHDTQSGVDDACGLGDEGSIERELLLLESWLLEEWLLLLLLERLLEKRLLLT